ncbi:MAG TPA: sulfite exporter TauE/SafE family protein [Candidatus Ozemobacteraceae bacterium]|nr:sulfite exporter TauE/SafE family protein [Candidatus Ozemobacteraceae bacterium]
MIYLAYLAWGAAIGILSSMIGLGGGVLIVPTLIWLFGLTQHQAQGTSLALMIPPIGLLAAYKYWLHGNVILPIAICGALGFFLGGYLGADLAHWMNPQQMRRLFGIVLVTIGISFLVT